MSNLQAIYEGIQIEIHCLSVAILRRDSQRKYKKLFIPANTLEIAFLYNETWLLEDHEAAATYTACMGQTNDPLPIAFVAIQLTGHLVKTSLDI